MAYYGDNLRRLMAAKNLTLAEVARRSGLDVRTINGILNNPQARPHARTLHKLARGLRVPVEELFQAPPQLIQHPQKAVSHPGIRRLIQERPDLFDGWEPSDFARLETLCEEQRVRQAGQVIQLAALVNRMRQLSSGILRILASPYGPLFVQTVNAFLATLDRERSMPNGTTGYGSS